MKASDLFDVMKEYIDLGNRFAMSMDIVGDTLIGIDMGFSRSDIHADFEALPDDVKEEVIHYAQDNFQKGGFGAQRDLFNNIPYARRVNVWNTERREQSVGDDAVPHLVSPSNEEWFINLLDELSKASGIPFVLYADGSDRVGGYWNNKEGQVYINTAFARDDTPLHEYAHIFIPFLKQENPELYKNLFAGLSEEDAVIKLASSFDKTKEETLIRRVIAWLQRMISRLTSGRNVVKLSPDTTLNELTVIMRETDWGKQMREASKDKSAYANFNRLMQSEFWISTDHGKEAARTHFEKLRAKIENVAEETDPDLLSEAIHFYVNMGGKIPDENLKGHEDVMDLARNLTDDQKTVADELAAEYRTLYSVYNRVPFPIHYRFDYAPQWWTRESVEKRRGKGVPAAFKPRENENIYEGWKKEYELSHKRAEDNLREYIQKMSEHAAKEMLVSKMLHAGILSAEMKTGWVPLRSVILS